MLLMKQNILMMENTLKNLSKNGHASESAENTQQNNISEQSKLGADKESGTDPHINVPVSEGNKQFSKDSHNAVSVSEGIKNNHKISTGGNKEVVMQVVGQNGENQPYAGPQSDEIKNQLKDMMQKMTSVQSQIKQKNNGGGGNQQNNKAHNEKLQNKAGGCKSGPLTRLKSQISTMMQSIDTIEKQLDNTSSKPAASESGNIYTQNVNETDRLKNSSGCLPKNDDSNPSSYLFCKGCCRGGLNSCQKDTFCKPAYEEICKNLIADPNDLDGHCQQFCESAGDK
jgi:hypothetical protein